MCALVFLDVLQANQTLVVNEMVQWRHLISKNTVVLLETFVFTAHYCLALSGIIVQMTTLGQRSVLHKSMLIITQRSDGKFPTCVVVCLCR